MFAKLQELREERESGFTLIELLVVILIIGILAAIAIPAFLNQRKSAVDAGVKSDIKNAATAVETWAVKNPVEGVTQADVADKLLTSSDATDLTLVSAGPGDYVIKGTNADGDVASTAGFIYKSTEGGFIEASAPAEDTTPEGTVVESMPMTWNFSEMMSGSFVHVTGTLDVYDDGTYTYSGTVDGVDGTLTAYNTDGSITVNATVVDGAFNGSGTIAGYNSSTSYGPLSDAPMYFDGAGGEYATY